MTIHTFFPVSLQGIGAVGVRFSILVRHLRSPLQTSNWSVGAELELERHWMSWISCLG